MRGWQRWLLLALILASALALRWTGLDWDGYQHYHPDERYITWVATTIEWPTNWQTALIPAQSTFNPFFWPVDAASKGIEVLQGEPRDYAYGHLPLYLGVIATRFVEAISPAFRTWLPQTWLITTDIFNAQEAVEFRHLTAVSRALTGLVDAGTIAVLFLLGRRIFGTVTGLLAAAFLAVNVMHIQLAHFFTADPYLSFFTLAALYFMVRSVTPGRSTGRTGVYEPQAKKKSTFCQAPLCNLLLAGLFIGLAVGSKFSAVLLLFPFILALWMSEERHKFRILGAAVILAFFTFLITNPFAVLDFSCEAITPAANLGPITIPRLNWGSCYLKNIIKQATMVRGDLDLGFTRQYAGTIPYLYPIEMQVRWGMGWALGITAFAGFIWAIWRVAAAVKPWLSSGQALDFPMLPAKIRALIILLSWSLLFFLTTAGFYVKFMRYLLPLTPVLMLFAAAMLAEWHSRKGRLILTTAVLAITSVYALSFVNIYQADHPWEIASRWVYENITPGTLLASEQWDDSLPTSLILDGRPRRRAEYRDEQLTWLTGPDELDDLFKFEQNLNLLARADYVILMSNRVYGVVPRLPDRYPLSSQYHQLLMDGSLGYEPVFVNTRRPNLFGIHLKPDSFSWPGLQPPPEVENYLSGLRGVNGGRFDESFTVYDQPLVIIFANVEGQTADELRQKFVID